MTSAKYRLSNIELLRVFSMFGVLIVHSDFGALKEPTFSELLSSPGYTIIRTFIEAFAIVAVNVFVLISGWFGINFRWSSLSKLLFQCAFFFFGIYSLLYICGLTEIGLLKGIYMCLMLSENAWFVKSYMGMFIFAPVMNAFIEHTTKKQIKIFLISFYIFQSVYGWISNGASYIAGGYSAFSFMGLYLLARYVRVYKPQWSQWDIQKDFVMYVLFSTMTALCLLLFIYLDIYPLFAMFCKYSSVLMIAAALFLLLAFSKISFSNKYVNRIAASCFAVYLFHFILFPQYMCSWIQFIASKYSGIVMFGLIIAILLGFYVMAILLDQIRIVLWNNLFVRYFKGNNDTDKR